MRWLAPQLSKAVCPMQPAPVCRIDLFRVQVRVQDQFLARPESGKIWVNDRGLSGSSWLIYRGKLFIHHWPESHILVSFNFWLKPPLGVNT